MKAPTLYHALKVEHLHAAVCRNALRGYSTHRISDNGLIPWCKNHKSPSKEYLESKWYFGVCLTRDIRFAHAWNDAVLEFDRHALVARNKVVPYNWMETKVKAEAEEFVVTGAAGFTCGQAMISVSESTDVARKNLKFLTDDNSFVGEIDRLGHIVKSITIQIKDRPGLLRLTEAAEKEQYAWRLSRFCAVEKDIVDFCAEHNIALNVLT